MGSRVRTHIVLLALVIAALGAAGSALAGDLRVEASVDSKSVSVGQNLTLTITVYGDGKIPQPDLTGLDGFAVASSYSSQSISIVNAKMSKSVSLSYVLTAVKEGDFTLGPFAVKSGKDTYETEPIAVRVGPSRGQAGGQTGGGQQGLRQPPPGGQGGPQERTGREGERAIMAFASVDKKKAYVGEQITYTMTFAYRADVEDAEFREPEHTGFWTEPLDQAGTPSVRVIDGVKYYTVSKSTAFFPISSGRFTIGPSGVRYIVSNLGKVSRDPFNFFMGDPFQRSEGVAATEPVSIEVLPLPQEGEPSDFSGAVGRFDLSVVPSSNEVRVGESITLSIRVEGAGNIRSIGEVKTPKLEGFRVFAPKARDSVRVVDNRVGGAKIFDLVLVPEVMGKAVLDGFTLSYFDPGKGAYVRADAKPIEISVLEGDENTMRALAAAGGRATRLDIRHIRRVPHVKDDLTLIPPGTAGAVSQALPVVIGIAGVAVVLHRRHMAKSGKAKTRRAFRALGHDLRLARTAVGRGDAAEASATVAKAIRSYIAGRCGANESAVDASLIESISDIPEDARKSVNGLLASLDRVRFAPVSSSSDEMRSLIVEAEETMRKVEEAWRK